MAPLAEYLANLNNNAVLAVTIGVVALLVIVVRALLAPSDLPDVPLVGEPAGCKSFSLRTRWRYYTDCAALYDEAYQNVSLDTRFSANRGLTSLA